MRGGFTFAAYLSRTFDFWWKYWQPADWTIMAEMDWSKNAVIILVKEYTKRPELWDRNDPMYRVQSAKNAAWSAIARMFACEITDVRKKFNSLLASYRRERQRVTEGSASQWFLYPYMSFLTGYVKSPEDGQGQGDASTAEYEQVETLDSTFEHESDVSPASEEEQEEMMLKREPEAEAFEYKKIPYPTRKRTIKAVKRKVTDKKEKSNGPDHSYSKVYINSKILEMERSLRKDLIKKKDDCDTFGEYIATTLRKHDNKTQCMIKQAINNILFEQEMSKYSSNEYVILNPGDNSVRVEDILED